MTEKYKDMFKYWSKVFVIALLVILVIRTFFIASYSVSSIQMETSLLKGDRVLVNKTAYGIRMPVTLLSIPFVFDSIAGLRTYSDAVQFGYNRLFASQVERNDIVVFNNPLETDKPLDKRSVCISRCVASPGDTVFVDGFAYLINGKQYVTSPDFLMQFRFPDVLLDTVRSLARHLDIPLRNLNESDSLVYASLNRYESFLINKNLPDTMQLQIAEKDASNYKVLVPKKGMKIELNEQTIPLYKKLILDEQGQEFIFLKSKFYCNGKPVDSYIFRNDYYWFLSDNVDESVDSRYVGFISERDIIGRASFVWYSSAESGVRWSRIFSSVK
ncbi:signal peptidase I [Dysgonomonas sp. PH5-45]|uniref:signal peptidase I n=1 Tax=unclassified Dysgonomonas TaxID=2630389 RepID=UPI002476093C|nr:MULTISPECIES: signal peptidase I [unclassified Dysgonomonas]MDH6353697.1 signal peptidase I [Dysgonomonas sp. PH5-45]MDH6386600.1 signal peptidase I [Dysgonomonas sp. PH5-37]